MNKAKNATKINDGETPFSSDAELDPLRLVQEHRLPEKMGYPRPVLVDVVEFVDIDAFLPFCNAAC